MALTINEVLNNNPSIAEIRGLAARLGLPVEGKKKHELLDSLGQYERETDALRLECGTKGLDTTGERADLTLRLAQANVDSLSAGDRRAYRISVVIALAMGVAGLGISLPHVSLEIGRLMGCGWFFGLLMGLVIDGGFITMKVVDCLKGKFSFTTTQTFAIRGIMGICLTISAALNASQFLRHVKGGTPIEQGLAVAFAVFISVFVFAMFYVGASMLVRCQDKASEQASQNEDPADKLERAAAEIRRLRMAGSRI